MPSTPIHAPGVDLRESPRGRLTGTDLLLFLMALIWGINISVVKHGTSVMKPLAYNSIRVAIAALTLCLVGAAMKHPWPSRRDMLQLLLLGMLGNGIYQVLFAEGVSRTLAGNAALVLAATPAFILLLGWMRKAERVSNRGVLGVALSIAGVLLVVGTGAASASSRTLAGDALVLLGCICWALFTVLLKPYTHRLHTIHIAAVTMLGGLPPLILFSLPQLLGTQWGVVPMTAWYSMLFSGIIALVVAYLLWYHGLRVLGPTRTAMYSNLQPAIALLFAWFLLGEAPTILQGLGAGGILTGILLTRA